MEEIKKEYVKPFTRLYSWIINIVIIFFLAVVLDRVCINTMVKNGCGYSNIYQNYETLNTEYEEIEDNYQIYIYDEDNNRIKNENITQEMSDSFFQDSRVMELRHDIPLIQDKLVRIQLIVILVDAVTAVFIEILLLPIFFKKGQTLGDLFTHIYPINKDSKLLSTKEKILLSIYRLLIYLILGIITVGILPCYSFIKMYYDDKRQAMVDRIMKITYIVDQKYLK